MENNTIYKHIVSKAFTFQAGESIISDFLPPL